jgi:hypothetical protein
MRKERRLDHFEAFKEVISPIVSSPSVHADTQNENFPKPRPNQKHVPFFYLKPDRDDLGMPSPPATDSVGVLSLHNQSASGPTASSSQFGLQYCNPSNHVANTQVFANLLLQQQQQQQQQQQNICNSSVGITAHQASPIGTNPLFSSAPSSPTVSSFSPFLNAANNHMIKNYKYGYPPSAPAPPPGIVRQADEEDATMTEDVVDLGSPPSGPCGIVMQPLVSNVNQRNFDWTARPLGSRPRSGSLPNILAALSNEDDSMNNSSNFPMMWKEI